jgi:hypothetical protein
MKRMLLFALLVLAACLPLMAQDVPPTPPADWGDIIMNPSKWFVDFGAVSMLTAFLATFAIGLLRVTNKFVKQLVAWLVAIALLVATDLLNWGYAADFPILLAVVHGFAAGLAANGIFDIPVLKGLLDVIAGWMQPKKR